MRETVQKGIAIGDFADTPPKKLKSFFEFYCFFFKY